jgi:uncharacterized protein YcnI
MKNFNYAIAAAALLMAAGAQAHVTLEEPAAVANTSYKAVLRITHGCEGSATHTVRVQVPDGFLGAKPMPRGIHLQHAGTTASAQEMGWKQAAGTCGRIAGSD